MEWIGQSVLKVVLHESIASAYKSLHTFRISSAFDPDYICDVASH